MSRRKACGLVGGALLAAALPARLKASDSKDEPLEFRPAYEEWAPGRILVTVEEKRLYLGEERIGGDVVETFNVVEYGIAFTLSEEGGRRLKELSARHLQKPLAVIYAGEVLIAPKVMGVMERRGQITMKSEGVERLKRLIPMKQR
ncbi:MAG: hypothetical protein AAGK22_09645 [Acidobacteriota bacterium]